MEKKPERPPAPEERVARAAAQAAALETSAAALRDAGLDEKAAELQAESTRLRKSCAALPPGKRLDAKKAFVDRCEGRLARARQAASEAWAALERAQAQEDEAKKELVQAKAELDELRTEVVEGAAEPAEAKPLARARWGSGEAPVDTESELHSLRAKLQRTEAERDDALAAAQPVPATQDEMEVHELEAELAEERAKHKEVLKAGGLPPAPALKQLADLTARLDRRKGAEPY